MKNSKPLTIAFVLDDTLDSTDGIQQYVLAVSNWLRSRGHTIHFFVGESKRTDMTNLHSLARNIKVKFNGNTMSMPLPVKKNTVQQLLSDVQPNIVHVQVPYSPFMSGVVLRALPQTVGAVGTFHILPFGFVVSVANKCLSVLTHSTDKRFDAMMAVSPPAAMFAKKTYGFTPTVVPNPIDTKRFRPPKTATDTFQRVVFLGRLVERKGAKQLLEAIAYASDRHMLPNNVQVHIGGKGEQMAMLQAFAHNHQLDDIVQFDGFIAEENKVAYLSQADIAVFPSVSGESFGISLLEAMAVSRGVVLGGNNPGYASVMHGLKEQLFDPNDTPAFAALLAHWLKSPAERQQAAMQQKAYVQQFSIDVVGEQIESMYYDILQKREQSAILPT